MSSSGSSAETSVNDAAEHCDKADPNKRDPIEGGDRSEAPDVVASVK
jgi:hypothetical protein